MDRILTENTPTKKSPLMPSKNIYLGPIDMSRKNSDSVFSGKYSLPKININIKENTDFQLNDPFNRTLKSLKKVPNRNMKLD